MPDDIEENKNDGDAVHPQQKQDVETTVAVIQYEPLSQRTPKCGLCCWRPDCLQPVYNWKLALVLICSFTFLRGLLSVGFNSVSSSSFERRFGVGSEQIGWFSSSSKFAIGISTIIFSYYGDRTTNKPRLIAFSVFLMVIGSFLMALPHFIMEPYRAQAQTLPPLCYRDDEYYSSVFTNSSNVANVDTSVKCKDSSSAYFNILIAANVIMGVSTGIYVSVAIAFIDDFSTIASSGFNLGMSYLSNAIGSGIGFGVGSVLMGVDVNINMPWVPKQNRADPTFLGAWWLGYTICIGLFFIVSLGFLFFDDELPESAKLKAEKLTKSQTHVSNVKVDVDSRRSKIVRLFASFLDHILKVIANPVVILLTIATILSTLTIAGIQPFLVKIMQTVYGISEMMAGMTMGVVLVVGIALGSFLSGVMVKRLEMAVRSMLLVSFVFTILSSGFTFLVAFTCDPEKLAGVTYDFEQSTYFSPADNFNLSNLDLTCNAGCKCKSELYMPACNFATNVEFYSPCYAGCEHFVNDATANKTDFFSFNNCKCLSKDSSTNSTSTMKYGLCSNSNCPRMYIAQVGVFLMLFCGFFIVVPVTETIMRCVPFEERSFSLAFFESMQCFLGAVPGPLMMGVIFDKSCIMRQPSTCVHKDGNGEVGPCIAYDSFKVTWSLIGMMAGFSFLSAICYVIAFFLYRPPNGETFGQYFRNTLNWWLCNHEKPTPTANKEEEDVGGHDGPYTEESPHSEESINLDDNRPKPATQTEVVANGESSQ